MEQWAIVTPASGKRTEVAKDCGLLHLGVLRSYANCTKHTASPLVRPTATKGQETMGQQATNDCTT